MSSIAVVTKRHAEYSAITVERIGYDSDVDDRFERDVTDITMDLV